MEHLDWRDVEGAIRADETDCAELKTLLHAIGAYERREAVAFVLYEKGMPAVPRSHPVWDSPCIYGGKGEGVLRYLGDTGGPRNRVRVWRRCATHEYLGPLLREYPEAVVYAVPTPRAGRRCYDREFVPLFPHLKNKSGNPKVAAASQSKRVRLVLERIHAAPGITKTAAISGMCYGTGEHILAQLTAERKVFAIEKPRGAGHPTIRYYPGRGLG